MTNFKKASDSFGKFLTGVKMIVKKIEDSKIIRAIRKGFTDIVPILLIGAFVLVILNLPIPEFTISMIGRTAISDNPALFQEITNKIHFPGYGEMMRIILGDDWKRIGLAVHRGTMGVMAVAAVISISNAYIRLKSEFIDGRVQGIAVIIVALASFFAYNFKGVETLSGFMDNIGAAGILPAVLISILSAEIFVFISNMQDKIRRMRKTSSPGNYLTYNMFKIIIPALVSLIIFASFGWLSEILLGENNMTIYFTNAIVNNMTDDNVFFPIVLVFLTMIFWFMGMHGGNIVLDSLNHSASTFIIFNKPFFDVYVFLGGAGATIGLLAALLIVSKKKREKAVVKASIIPGIFNINETLVYGLPMIFSPYFLIPFLFTPVILTLTTFGAMSLGLVPPISLEGNTDVYWTTPILLSGGLYTSPEWWKGFLLQVVNLSISVIMYIPFARLYNRRQNERQIETFKELQKEIYDTEHDEIKHSLLSRSDEIGQMANALLDEIRVSFSRGEDILHLEYQPKVDYDNTVVGCEALLRWEHSTYGYISPAVILRLIEDADMMIELGDVVTKTAWKDFLIMQKAGIDVQMSVNLSPIQLKDDDKLLNKIRGLISEFNLDPKKLELELTENKAIYSSEEVKYRMKMLRSIGINVSIDDFGMGHSSLLYLSDLYANIVKIDMELVRAIATDNVRRNIVESIISLCKQLKVEVIAEGVETKEQLDTLEKMGCDYYQGWYFSKSLPIYKFIEYYKLHHKKDKKKKTK